MEIQTIEHGFNVNVNVAKNLLSCKNSHLKQSLKYNRQYKNDSG